MSFSLYSFGLFAALSAFVQALPTVPSTPSLGDLSSTGNSEAPEIPEIPSPSSTGGSTSGSSGSSFMGVDFSNTIDLGDLEHLPTITTDFLAGSIQNYDGGDDSDSDDEGSSN